MAEQVKLPKAMLDILEEQAIELKELKDVLSNAARVLKNYQITAVVTAPPSGRDAPRILQAVQALVSHALVSAPDSGSR